MATEIDLLPVFDNNKGGFKVGLPIRCFLYGRLPEITEDAGPWPMKIRNIKVSEIVLEIGVEFDIRENKNIDHDVHDTFRPGQSRYRPT